MRVSRDWQDFVGPHFSVIIVATSDGMRQFLRSRMAISWTSSLFKGSICACNSLFGSIPSAEEKRVHCVVVPKAVELFLVNTAPPRWLIGLTPVITYFHLHLERPIYFCPESVTWPC